MLGRMDSFWILVAIMIGSGIIEWIKKRGQQTETDSSTDDTQKPRPPLAPTRSGPAPPPIQTPLPTHKLDWEEELRRLLEGEKSGSTPLPSPPPIVIQKPEPMRHPIATPSVQPTVSKVPTTSRAESEEGPDLQLVSLTESAGAYEKASQLQETVADQLKEIDDLTARHPVSAIAPRRVVSPEISKAISLMRDPRSVRQALIASTILGPPKSLEN